MSRSCFVIVGLLNLAISFFSKEYPMPASIISMAFLGILAIIEEISNLNKNKK